MYDNGVVEEDAFRLWRSAEAPTAPKTALLARLADFYTWLDTAREED